MTRKYGKNQNRSVNAGDVQETSPLGSKCKLEILMRLRGSKNAFAGYQDWSAQNSVQHACGQTQPCTSSQINPTPDLTLTLIPSLWGARGRQGPSRDSGASLGGVFPTKKRVGRKARLDQ